ncbi:MAG: teichuronic acid biosynthesis glycosyltransferase TuaH, partial [Actinomycetota bacterium]|nr:teichuronic acid biosynthesis glycosyltransferase TuaH [Actinomycetota bacterium]
MPNRTCGQPAPIGPVNPPGDATGRFDLSGPGATIREHYSRTVVFAEATATLPGMQPGRDWAGTVVIYATNPWDGVKFQDRHLAERLTRFAPVLYVNRPVSRLTRRRGPERRAALIGPRLRRIGPRLAVLTPEALPGPERRYMAAITERLVHRRVEEAIAELGGSIGAVIDGSVLLESLGADSGVRKVFWAPDDSVGGAELFGQDPARIARNEVRHARAADVIVASSPMVAGQWRARGFDPELIPFGCDAAQYADVDALAPASDVTLPSPIVGSVGYLNDRIDIDLLLETARRGRSLLRVGGIHSSFDASRLDELLAFPNVQWVGFKEFTDLPAYLRVIDVGIVPYTRSAFNLGSFPLKTLEYLAAGRAV